MSVEPFVVVVIAIMATFAAVLASVALLSRD
jgi:hypothetical protein